MTLLVLEQCEPRPEKARSGRQHSVQYSVSPIPALWSRTPESLPHPEKRDGLDLVVAAAAAVARRYNEASLRYLQNQVRILTPKLMHVASQVPVSVLSGIRCLKLGIPVKVFVVYIFVMPNEQLELA